MSEQVVTELVIDANTSGASQYVQAMEGAEQAASKFSAASNDLTINFVALGAGALAGFAAVKGGLDFVAGANKDLADLAKEAKQTGLTLSELQAINYGGKISGLSDKQLNLGLQESSKLLNEAGRQANTLSKELAENGISVKKSNGDLVSQNELLKVAGGLIANAKNPGDQNAIAAMLGFTKEWVPLLEQGAGAIAGLGDEAKKAGAIIDDETIQRATDFDKDWRKSSVEFSLYMKSALAGLLPYVDDLIERAAKFVKTIDRDALEKHAQESLKNLGDATGVPDEAALKIHPTPEAIKIVEDISNAGSLWEGMSKTFSFFASRTPVADVAFVDPTSVPGYAASKLTEPSYPSAEAMDKAFDKNSTQRKADAAQDAAQDASDSFSKVAKTGRESNDVLDRAIITLDKHTATTAANADAVGLGAGALAGFRAEAQLTAAAIANGTKITPELSAKFKNLADDARDAADDLAKVKIASQIKFGADTAFLTPQDVQIASQLKDIYGTDVTAALESSQAAALRLNAGLRAVNDTGLETTKTFATDLRQALQSGSSAWDSFAKAGSNALNKIADKLSSMAIDNLWSKAFGGSSGLGGSLGSLFGLNPNAGGSTLAGSTGNVDIGGYSMPQFANGTDSAPGGWATIGERGPEKMFVPKGASIIPNGGSPGGSVTAPVQINIDATGADPAGLARVEAQLSKLREDLPNTIVTTVKKAKAGRSL